MRFRLHEHGAVTGSGTHQFVPASRGGERRVRALVGLVRRAAAFGLRYRLRELQLLIIPCGVALMSVWWPASTDRQTLISALGFCLLLLVCNFLLTVAAPWADQHLWPPAALLLALRFALAGMEQPGEALAALEATLGLPGMGAAIALYAAIATRGLRVALLQREARAYAAAAPAAILAAQAAVAVAAHLRLVPAMGVAAPFLDEQPAQAALAAALLGLLLRLSSDAGGAQRAAEQAGTRLAPAEAAGAAGAAAARRLQRAGAGCLVTFLALLAAAAWRAFTG